MASDEHAGRILLELDVMGDIQAQLEKVASNIKSTLSKSMSGYKIDLAGVSKEAGKQGNAIGKKLRDAISKATEKSSEIEVEADTSSIKNDVNSISENVASELRGVVDGILRELRQAIQGINSSIAVVPKASGSPKTKDGASSGKRARAPPIDIDTDSIRAEMVQLEESIAAAEKRANGFRETMYSLKDQLNDAFSDISKGATEVDREVREMMYESTKGELTPLIEKANQSMNRAGNEALRLQNKYAALEKKLQDVEKANKKSVSLFSRLGSAAKGVGSVLSSVFRKARGPIKNFIGHVGSAVSKMTGLRGIISRFGNSASKASGGVFRLANMLKLMAIRMAIRGVINGAKEGLQNLAQYSGEVNGSMSMLISALAQLKNAFATAFAPILNLVAPVLSTLISLLTQAATAIASFFAALTGKSSVIVAKKVTSDYAASLNGTAGAAGAANEALKEEQKTLMGFDQINKLDAPSDSGSSGGGGAGGGMASGDMFEEVPIESSALNVASKVKAIFSDIFSVFKSAWDNEGANTIGAIKGAFENVKILLGSIGKSFMEVFTNGTGQQTVETILRIFQNILGCIGNLSSSISSAWNDNGAGTALLQSWLDLLNIILGHWESLSSTISQWLGSIDFSPLFGSLTVLGDALGGIVQLSSDIMTGLLQNVLLPLGSWVLEEAGPASIDAFSLALDALAKILSPVFDGIMTLWDYLQPVISWIESVAIVIIDALGSIFEKIGKVFEEKGSKIKEIFAGIGEVISTVWTVIEPIMNLLKTLFGTVFDFIGDIVGSVIGTIIDVFGGLIDFIAGVFSGDWSRAWNGILSIFSGIWDGIKGVISAAVSFITSIFKTLASVLSSIWNGIWGAIKGVINGILGGIEGMANGIIRGINFVINALNKLHFDIPDWVPLLGGKSFGFNIPNLSEVSLPRLATGGVIDTPTLAMIGENGQEAVMPLEKNTGWIDSLAQKLNDKAGSKDDGQIVEILMMILKVLQEIGAMDVYMDTTKVTDIIIKELRARKKRTGKDPVYS